MVGTSRLLLGILAILTAYAALPVGIHAGFGPSAALGAALILPLSGYATLRVLERSVSLRRLWTSARASLHLGAELDALRARRADLQLRVESAVARFIPDDMVPLYPRGGAGSGAGPGAGPGGGIGADMPRGSRQLRSRGLAPAPRAPSRRRVLGQLGAALGLAAAGAPSPARAEGGPVLTRPIPRTGEPLPVVGLGTWQTLDVDPADPAAMGVLAEVLGRFLALGGTVVDSSPMYGRSEAVAGALLARLGVADDAVFRATKVWTEGRDRGLREMARSAERMGGKIDLMQIHNLVDWRVHLDTLRAWKAEGRIRYLGVTHYQRSAFGVLEQILRTEQVDFVQLPYSVGVREAEARLLPAAAATGTAVLVMQPFEEGALFDRVRGQPVPEWAAEIGCASWAQLFLKWILGHPAVHCPIPATGKVSHVVDNLGAAVGPLPDEAFRERIRRAVFR